MEDILKNLRKMQAERQNEALKERIAGKTFEDIFKEFTAAPGFFACKREERVLVGA